VTTPRLTPLAASAVLAMAAALAAAAPAHGFPHVVQRGETLASIAERVYGRIHYERILVHASSLDACGGVAITPGMILEIPAVTHRRASAGETWQGLARALLGDERRAEVLAQANGGKAWTPPEEGAAIVAPYPLRYVVSSERETIPSIASKFFADGRSAWMLDRYNNIGGRPLRRGDVVVVPLTDLPLTEAGKAEAAQSESAVCSEAAGAAREAQRKVASELPGLLGDVRIGHYVEAIARGTRLLALGELTRPQAADVHRSLAEAYTAVEAPGLAAAACQAWRGADPSANLDPMLVSPKILAACKAAEKSK
jgi:hypothetical protein